MSQFDIGLHAGGHGGPAGSGERPLRILGLNPGHDGAAALLEDGRLAWSLEAEKDSFLRNSPMSVTTIVQSLQILDSPPDVLAVGGWYRSLGLGEFDFGTGYQGLQAPTVSDSRVLGFSCKVISSSHERSHLFMCLGMAPDRHDECAILIWEGAIGAFYHALGGGRHFTRIPVMHGPGHRYGFLYCLADPRFDDEAVPLDVAGKLMALAAYGNADRASPDARRVVDELLARELAYSLEKSDFKESALFDCGFESEDLHNAARLLTDRIFDYFQNAAQTALPAGIPLLIGGGCGLNCEWNSRWSDLGRFTSVFVPPCPNDSGSAIGSAIDAQHALGGGTAIAWSVAAGAYFVHDAVPDAGWSRSLLSHQDVARVLASGQIVPFVQGRSEIGPRALGQRSLLASPLTASMTSRLNRLKNREPYRPIAPVCCAEDFGRYFEGRPDPFMLYFSRVVDPRIPAVTHVDGSARVQVAERESAHLHSLLESFGNLTGVAVLCNTSLNYPGRGFINRMSDLLAFCERNSLTTFVVDGDLWQRGVTS